VGLDEAIAVFDAVASARVSAPKRSPGVVTFEPPGRGFKGVTLRRELLKRYRKTYPTRNGTARVSRHGDGLLLESPFFGNFRMVPLSHRLFFVEDLEYYAVFDFDGGTPERITLHATRQVADFYSEIVATGAIEAIDRYEKSVSAGGDAIEAYDMDQLGHELLGTGRTAEAILVLESNASAHPRSTVVWESLGDAYASGGDEDAAVRYYKKSLELDPNNGAAAQKLERLGVSIEG
jgi:tetratricopeptide (TPR) repeat protein